MQQFIDYLEQNYNVVSVGNGDNVQLKNGECPFCSCSRQDLRLYYNIAKDKGICHHCGRGFNSTSFFAKREGVSFKKAHILLANDDVYKRTMKSVLKEDHCPYPTNAVSAKLERPFQYLSKRNVRTDTIDDLGIEFCQDDFVWNGRTIFVNNRIIFPICDDKGIVSWQGRDITGFASNKYFFPKGFRQSEYLYNYQNIVSNNYLIIVEGIFDVIGWYQAGFRNVVATFGKKISSIQLNMILTKQPKTVYMAWDSDAQKKKIEFARKNGHMFDIKMIDLKNKDADELDKDQLACYFNSASGYSWGSSILDMLN